VRKLAKLSSVDTNETEFITERQMCLNPLLGKDSINFKANQEMRLSVFRMKKIKLGECRETQ
jgi:hypothetical protein